MATIIAIPKLLVGFSLTIFAASFAFPSLAFSPVLLSRHKIQATSRLFLSVSGSEEEEVNNTGHDGSSLLHTVTTSSSMHRRNLLLGLLATTVATASSLPVASPALATGDEKLVPVYFGVGCFWHIQHEFIEAERKLLGRGDHALTAAAGYAGGKMADKEGRVCYHNFQQIADYGKMGHGEVVGLKLPEESIVEFAKVYFSLFDPRTKDRVDPQDRGGEYRSLLGLPGGKQHPVYPGIEAAAANAGFTLAAGKGNDPDTLGKRLVYTYDSDKFPFYQAEVYHQYHNDFQSPPYGKTYNSLADVALEEGRIHITGCPDRV